MFKSFRDGVLSVPRLPDPDVVRAWLRILIHFVLIALLAFLLSRASLVTLAPACALSPFAIALFATGVAGGISPAGLVAGCVLGAIHRDIESFNLSLPIGCAVVLAGGLAWSAAEPGLARLLPARRRAPEIQARSPNAVGDVQVTMVLAGLGMLAPGLIYADGELWPSIQAMLAATAAVSSVPFIGAALRAARPYLQMEDSSEARRRRGTASRGITPDAQRGFMLLGLMAEAGLFKLFSPCALGIGALTVTLAAPAGALTGLGLGLTALVFGRNVDLAAALGACGAAGQLCQREKWAVRVGCVAVTGLALALYLKLSYIEIVGLCAGPPLAMLLPEKVRARIQDGLRARETRCEPEHLAALLRADMMERLRAMSAAFEDLAEGYLTPVSLPDEQTLIGQLRDALCEGCAEYVDCWAGEHNRAARLLCDLVAEAVEDGETFFEEGAPPETARRCRRSRTMSERISPLLREYVSDRRVALKRAGDNRLIAAQFLQARQLIDGLVADQDMPLYLRDARMWRAVSALAEAEIDVVDAVLVPGDRPGLILTLREQRWTEALARRASRRLAEALGGQYGPAGALGRTMRFAQIPRLTAEVGAGCVSGVEGTPSGDSHLTAMLDGERLLVLICDGMGSGEAARRESAQAARLLGRFLKAGAEWPLAIETVNALLLNASTEDMFSTVDMMILNLSTGMAECMKLAACPTLIAREGCVERVEGGRLPLGILEGVQPAASRLRLMSGDTVLMASDGVMDAADPERVEELLREPGEDMNALSERVLALAQAAGAHRDDMTAVCVRIRDLTG